MSLQTPLARARGLGSAKKGVRHWWLQRLTAIVLVPLSLWFIGSILSMVGADHGTLVAWIRSPLVSALLLLFIVSLFYHAQLGLQVVIEDYIHTEWVKLTTLIAVQFILLLLGLTATIALLRIASGAA
jgi:succinate dehydrogenase / fumarate reductase membrane anchor subunit